STPPSPPRPARSARSRPSGRRPGPAPGRIAGPTRGVGARMSTGMERARATNLLLVRHAETECNVASRLSGWTDSHLSARGEAQVGLLAAHFNRAHGHAAAIYASPLVRTRRTAEAIARLTGHLPIFDPDLREMHFGELDGQPLELIKSVYAELLLLDESLEEDFAWPGGESRNTFAARVRAVIDRIAAAHPGQAVAVVTH